MNELDDLLLRVDYDEALISAFDDHQPELFAYFRDALSALAADGPLDLSHREITLIYDELRTARAVVECDYAFRIGVLIGARLQRGAPADYDGAAKLAGESVDEALPSRRAQFS